MLSEQPAELLDYISSFVDKPKDLLALALTAKLFYPVIVPNHLHFRDLRCDLRRKTLWRALAQCPGLASRFRSLDLVSETEEPGYPLAFGAIIFPRSFSDSGHADVPSKWISRRDLNRPLALSFEEECISAIAAAVSCMVGLTRFCWVSNGSQWTRQPEPLFAALRDSCPNLNELQIHAGEGWNNLFQFDTASSPLWQLSNLSKVSVSVHHSIGVKFRGPFKFVPLMMNMMVNNCPNLQELEIVYEGRKPIYITPIFTNGHWPRLKRLTTDGDVTLQGDEAKKQEIFESFLARHSELELLHLHGCFRSRAILFKSETLPQLRSLSLNTLDIPHLNSFDVLQRLQYLASIHLHGYPPADPDQWEKFLHHLRRMHGLRCISVGCDDLRTLRDLAGAFPQVERLRFGFERPWKYDNSMTSLVEDDIGVEPPPPEYFEIFATLDRLTHISNFMTINKPSAFDKFMNPILEGLSRARNLRYVEVYFARTSIMKWVTIDRREDGTYAGWHPTENLQGVRFEDWEGIFTHITDEG